MQRRDTKKMELCNPLENLNSIMECEMLREKFTKVSEGGLCYE